MPAATRAVSEKKLAANRANAARSTGPRTPAGKRRSSRNATTHAAYAADLVLPSESTANFVALRRAALAGLAPQTPLELGLADRAVNLVWRLGRLQAAETGLLASEEADFADHARAFARDYNARPGNGSHPRRVPAESLGRADLPPGLAAVVFFETPDNPLDRLSRVEHRLQGMLHRTLAQLTALQTRRESHGHAPLPCPYLDDPDDPTATPATAPTTPPPVPATTRPPCNAVQPDATATLNVQNEPTALPSARSVSSGVNLPSATPGSATPRDSAQQLDPPAQNEPTEPVAYFPPLVPTLPVPRRQA